MDNHIMVGCDLHDKTMLLKIAAGRGKAQKRSFENSPSGRKAMLAHLRKRAGACGGTRIGVSPAGAQLRRTNGAISMPVSSRKTIQAFSREALF